MKKAKKTVKSQRSSKEPKKHVEKETASLLMFIAISTIAIVFFWVFIIMMSLRYSERGGQLWGYMFGYTSIFTFFLVEPFYVF
jgi:heme/copper-type cytochrome/quinol oxidase subunit 2